MRQNGSAMLSAASPLAILPKDRPEDAGIAATFNTGRHADKGVLLLGMEPVACVRRPSLQ